MRTSPVVDSPLMRGHNEGSMSKRKDGRWQVRATMPDGRRVYRYLSRGATKRQARDLLTDLLTERESHLDPGAAWRLGPFLRRWLADFAPSLRPSTYLHYEMIVRVHLEPALGRYRLTDLTPAIVQRYLTEASSRVSPQTVRHHRSVLRRALNVALAWGYVRHNVAALASPPRVPEREASFLDAHALDAVLWAAQGDRWHALWSVAATTGMRQAEILGLTWRDIGEDRIAVERALTRRRGMFELVEPKTRRSRRSVPLLAATGLALRAHRARQHQERLASGNGGPYDGLVFTSERGQPLHASDVLRAWHRALDAAELPRVTFHSLRHGAASMWLAAGVPPRMVMELLGHTTMRMTMETYGHVAKPLLVEAAAAMERAMGGAS